MRIVTKKTLKTAGPALAAAVFSTLLSGPMAHAGFTVTILGPYTDTENSADQVYVATALNTGAATSSNVTGSDLAALDVTITTSVAMGIDVEQAGSGNFATYTANVDGTTNNASGPDAGSKPVFGDGAGGTFIGVGEDLFASNPHAPSAAFDPTFNNSAYLTVGGTQDVYTNSNVGAASPTTSNYTGQKLSTFDPAFQPVNPGTTNNGDVTALEVVDSASSGSGVVLASQFAVPFANIVVPKGATGTVSGLIGGDVGLNVPFSVTFGTPVSTGGPTLSLTSSAPTGSTEIGSGITISGQHGSYVPTPVLVPSAAQTNGYLEVSGFTPSTDPEVYALTATPGTGENLSALIAELNTAVSSADTGAQAVAITPTIANLFPTADIEVDIPGADGSNPAFLAYNLTGDSTGPKITAIGVVPEPTGIGFLVVGGLGLLARRRRAMQA